MSFGDSIVLFSSYSGPSEVLDQMFDQIEEKNGSFDPKLIVQAGTWTPANSEGEAIPYRIEIESHPDHLETRTFVKLEGAKGNVWFCKAYSERTDLKDLINSSVKSALEGWKEGHHDENGSFGSTKLV